MRRKIRILLPALAAVFCSAYGTTALQAKDPLLFPVDSFTVETRMVKTFAGEKKVTCRSWLRIPYVANPVDKDYQSLNVIVPVKVGDDDIDATNAPILFSIGVGGYLSVNNARSSPGLGAGRGGSFSTREELALAAGYVVVFPGCRGRDNQAADGTYFGKAPAAIVDLKAAVRYIRHNKGIIPGNVERIISAGCSAGGALSALLGTSGNNRLFEKNLREIGAARADDHIFACACFSPITDLDHADMAYEWMFGPIPTRSGLVDQELSNQLRNEFRVYQASLNLRGKNGFGLISADNYDQYLVKYYLIPSANRFLAGLSDIQRNEYLDKNSWITWSDGTATLTFSDYVSHTGRMKGLPAFDDFAMKQPEPVLFGNSTANARHFTSFSLRQNSGDKNEELESELQVTVNMMNAMYFVLQDNKGCARFWWLRNGSKDNHTSQTVMTNLAVSLENREKEVDAFIFWDGGHCADDDPEGFIEWISDVTGYTIHPASEEK